MDNKQRWQQYYHLKSLPRSGWLRKGIDPVESVAAHSWGLALLCMEFAPRVEPPLNVKKTLQLALAHDLPEVIVGDITPHDGISVQEKHCREQAAAQSILTPQTYTLWREYDQNSSREAKFVHCMDKIDMALQATMYETQADTSEFIQSAWNKIPADWQWIWEALDLPIQS